MKLVILQDKIKELEKQVAKFKSLALHDELTELYNRRKFNKDISLACSNLDRYDEQFIVVLVDINKFKTINDKKGHLYGDKILKQLGKTINAQTRAGDRVYRLGGDEFSILLFHTDMEKALNLIKRIKTEVSKYKITISCGIKEGYCNCDSTLILNEVDKRMYEEKRK